MASSVWKLTGFYGMLNQPMQPWARSAAISTENILFWLIIDPIAFGLGSIGGYILFRELIKHERLPHRDEWIPLLKQHWFALLALGFAVAFSFGKITSHSPFIH